jgi:hypothetical protein
MRNAGTLGLGLIAMIVFGGEAFACQSGADDSGLDAPFMADVTITEMTTSHKKHQMAAFARVDKIYKGTIDSPSVKLVVTRSSCAPELRVGQRLNVMGILVRDEQGQIELQPFSK